MDSLYDTLSSGLSYVGDAVEKPGRAVRGVLAGKPREAMAAIPFSDSMGLTDPRQRTTGRDLTDHYNLTTRGSNSFGSHAAGFAADMVTDPLNVMSGVGAYKAAPTIAKGLKAGAKALTGLDLIESIGRGGMSLANKARGVPAPVKALPMASHADDLPDLGDFYQSAKKPTAYNPPPPVHAPVDEGYDFLHGAESGFEAAPPAIHTPKFLGGGEPVYKPQSFQGVPQLGDIIQNRHSTMAEKIGGAGKYIESSGLGASNADLMARPNRELEPWWRAAHIGNQEGIPVMAVPDQKWKLFNDRSMPNVMAHYRPAEHRIELNLGHRSSNPGTAKLNSPWLNDSLMRRDLKRTFDRGEFSSFHPDATIDHELGHAIHRDSMGLNPFFDLMQDGSMSYQQQAAAGHVSQYAQTNPLEAIAETYAGLRGGRDFRSTPDVSKLFREYAGDPMLNRMANNGLLKGLGLGVGGLAAGYGLSQASPSTSGNYQMSAL